MGWSYVIFNADGWRLEFIDRNQMSDFIYHADKCKLLGYQIYYNSCFLYLKRTYVEIDSDAGSRSFSSVPFSISPEFEYRDDSNTLPTEEELEEFESLKPYFLSNRSYGQSHMCSVDY